MQGCQDACLLPVRDEPECIPLAGRLHARPSNTKGEFASNPVLIPGVAAKVERYQTDCQGGTARTCMQQPGTTWYSLVKAKPKHNVHASAVQNGAWDDVSGENFLRTLLGMPIEAARWDTVGLQLCDICQGAAQPLFVHLLTAALRQLVTNYEWSVGICLYVRFVLSSFHYSHTSCRCNCQVCVFAGS